MRILIAYGSKRGGTAGLARMIGDELIAAGFQAVVQPARDAREVEAYDAVIVAGSIYAARWNRDARRFVRRNLVALRQRPVWLVSTGPLDDSAATKEIPPVKHVQAAMSATGALGQATFGGRLEADAAGFPASAMAKEHAGDWRDPAQVHRWIATVVEQLRKFALPADAQHVVPREWQSCSQGESRWAGPAT